MSFRQLSQCSQIIMKNIPSINVRDACIKFQKEFCKIYNNNDFYTPEETEKWRQTINVIYDNNYIDRANSHNFESCLLQSYICDVLFTQDRFPFDHIKLHNFIVHQSTNSYKYKKLDDIIDYIIKNVHFDTPNIELFLMSINELLLEHTLMYVMKNNVELTNKMFDNCVSHLPSTFNFLEHMLHNGFKMDIVSFGKVCRVDDHEIIKKIMNYITFKLTKTHFRNIVEGGGNHKSQKLKLILDSGYVMTKQNLLDTIKYTCEIINIPQYVEDMIDKDVINLSIKHKFYPSYIKNKLVSDDVTLENLIKSNDLAGIKMLNKISQIKPTKNHMKLAISAPIKIYDFLSQNGGITNLDTLNDNISHNRTVIKRLMKYYYIDRTTHLKKLETTVTKMYKLMRVHMENDKDETIYVDQLYEYFNNIMNMDNYMNSIPEQHKEEIIEETKPKRGRKKKVI